MKTIKGPAIFLAQFIGDKEPYNTLPGLAKWASGLGYKGVQLPSWADHIFNVDKAVFVCKPVLYRAHKTQGIVEITT